MLQQFGGYDSETPCKRRGKDGYSSDLEGYSQRAQTTAYRVQQQPLQNQSKSNSLPYNLNNNSQNVGRTSQQLDHVTRTQQVESASRRPQLDYVNRTQNIENVSRTPQSDYVTRTQSMESASRTQQSDNIINSTPQVDNSNRIPQVENRSPQISNSHRAIVHNDELYARQMQNNISNKIPSDNKNVMNLAYPPPSPSQFHRSKIMDQSTPISSDPPSGFTFNTSRSRSNSASGSNDDNENRNSDWRKDIYSDQVSSQGHPSMVSWFY